MLWGAGGDAPSLGKNHLQVVYWVIVFYFIVFFFSRYASLYFCCAVENQDNELLTLEIVHRYVELLDKYFGNVSRSGPLESASLRLRSHFSLFSLSSVKYELHSCQGSEHKAFPASCYSCMIDLEFSRGRWCLSLQTTMLETLLNA